MILIFNIKGAGLSFLVQVHSSINLFQQFSNKKLPNNYATSIPDVYNQCHSCLSSNPLSVSVL